jgi:hypothetical protein
MDGIPSARAKEVPMTRIVLDLDSPCPPERAIDALVDFTDRRPDLWPALAREFYQVASVGETSAEVREGSTKPIRVWAREHYDWSTPGTVRWTVIESNFCTPGSGVAVTVTDGRERGKPPPPRVGAAPQQPPRARCHRVHAPAGSPDPPQVHRRRADQARKGCGGLVSDGFALERSFAPYRALGMELTFLMLSYQAVALSGSET